ncbi:hypothetical protein GWI72_14595 [Microvirga tunisiensis]|uniref:Uncharacterized protein n=2 Tax=Pannonibacter tanglangensis TaxID=2750084 RepID=A0ABW9ZLS0_9HYPH|nr:MULTISPECIES: hypothetical protein [unclassified Pannonibacter]NBN64993.1 hypothetical protein [Pannonibacter sp. XCT-34]NBN79502.1 hypothetical protein [Pannonibacter sp. XCT-53]
MAEDDMDERRKKQADKIISQMTENEASAKDIAAQKKANKKAFGHEGSYDPAPE